MGEPVSSQEPCVKGSAGTVPCARQGWRCEKAGEEQGGQEGPQIRSSCVLCPGNADYSKAQSQGVVSVEEYLKPT